MSALWSAFSCLHATCTVVAWCIDSHYTRGTLCQALCRLFMACQHYSDVITSAIASRITSLTIVYSTVYSGIDQRKHQSSVSLAFVRGIHRWSVNSLHKWPVTRKLFPFDDIIMSCWLHAHVMLLQCSVVITQAIFLQNPHIRHPIAHPQGRVMGCLLWF